MQVHHGIYNDQYHLAHQGEDSPINIDIAGLTRPVADFHINCRTPKDMTISYYQMEYVLDGKVYIELENETYVAEKGDFYFINKATLRTLSTDKENPVSKLFVTAKGPLMDGMVKAYKFKDPIIIVKADVEKYFWNIIRILDEAPLYTPTERDNIGREILSIIQTVAREINTVDITNKHNIPRNILKYIDANLNRKFTIDELSENFFLGKTQLIKVFKEKYGITPMKYAQLQRIELAKFYLHQTDMPISSLHSAIGFDDVKYFSKFFKKVTGMSPREYRIERNKIDDPVLAGKFETLLRNFKNEKR